MEHHEHDQPDFGMGEKKLNVYLLGVVSCAILTVIAFYTVMANTLPRWQMFAVIFAAAFIQLVIQVICFLRLNTQTEQSRTNTMSFIFTIVILVTIIAGSLWIMSNLNYNMMMDDSPSPVAAIQTDIH